MKFLVIGNLTKDIIRTKKEKKVTFGGSSSYCSITAAKLGCETYVLSRGNNELDEWIKKLKIHGIRVELQKSQNITAFVNDYTHEKRVQNLLSDAGKIKFKPKEKMDVIHVGPVFNEVTIECVKEARKNCKLLSLDAQGFLREVKNKEVVNKFWDERDDFLKYIDLLKLGEHEISSLSRNKNYESVCNELLDLGVKVVELTLGKKGSIIAGKKIYRIPAYTTITIDPTGCGDVFASAFAIRYFETEDEKESGFFASSAASFVVEDFGTINIVGRDRVERRVEKLRGKK